MYVCVYVHMCICVYACEDFYSSMCMHRMGLFGFRASNGVKSFRVGMWLVGKT